MKSKTILVLVLGVLLAFTSVAAADKPDGPVSPPDSTVFLCPIVGEGVINADAHNGDNGVSVIYPPAGTSFLPGNNQAGAHANQNAYNGQGGPGPGNNPGHNPDFTPIWNVTP